MADEVFLVTGAAGCIGSWVIKHLTDAGTKVIASDLSDDRTRARLLMDDDTVAGLDWLKLDITDTGAVQRAVAERGVTNIVHLAGLQVPFCKANPPLGAAVNVTGTVNVFEAARQSGVKGLSYASSMAVFGPPEDYPVTPVPDDADRTAGTLYGVYKIANEDTARIYWQDWQVGSVGLRPGVVFGVGRDQGLTSDVAKATLAAAAGRPFHIRFDGRVNLQHASDTARMFIGCARANHRGAAVCNLRNDFAEVSDVVEILKGIVPGARITHTEGAEIPIVFDVDDRGLRDILGSVPHTPLSQALEGDVATFRDLVARDGINLGQLDV